MEHGRLRLAIDPGLGGGVAGLWLARREGWFPILRPAPGGAAWFNDLASYFLAPWPNRISGGRFVWEGREFAVTADWPDGTAIHGLVKDKPWRVVDRSPVSTGLEVRIREGYPWAFEARALYVLGESSLRIDLEVRNLGPLEEGTPERMPAGLGFHPFFPRKLWDEGDEVEVRCGVRGRYPARGMLPTGPASGDSVTEHLGAGRALGGLILDDVFLGSADGATISWPASGVRVRYECSESLGHTVIYTGDPGAERPRPFFCLEPVTMVNDGFNLMARGQEGAGAVGLGVGETLGVSWTAHIEMEE